MKLAALRMDIAYAISTTPPPLDHVLPGLLRGTVGALVAPGATGKSTLALQLAMGMAGGLPIVSSLLGDGRGKPVRPPAKMVLLLAEEDVIVMHHRLHGAIEAFVSGGLLKTASERHSFAVELAKNLHLYPIAGHGRCALLDGDGCPTDSMQELHDLCRGARLTVIDPLRQVHGGDENDSGHMNSVATGFQQLARLADTTVLLLHHATKAAVQNGGGDQAGAARGSSALTDAIRWQTNLSKVSEDLALEHGVPPKERRFLIRVDLAKANNAPDRAPILLQKCKKSGALTRWPGGKLISGKSAKLMEES